MQNNHRHIVPDRYEDTIQFLYERLPMFTRVGTAAYKKDLHNTLQLLAYLGNPHHAFRCIHIAGTNGKGSCSHMLAAVFHKAGYKTGLYTSPHLYDFRERIKVSGTHVLEMVPESFVISCTATLAPAIAEIEPSFFEVTVAMAFAWFAACKVDMAIIETGLGGRLDSTNVVNPELSIITNIGWDHMNLLGDTLEKIAGEKAGIIKKNIPAVIGEILPETKEVFLLKATHELAPLYVAQDIYSIQDVVTNPEKIEVTFRENYTGNERHIACDLPGIYQQYNLRTVLTALDILQKKGWNIGPEVLQEGLRHAGKISGLGGRWQVIGQKPLTVLDVAHNEQGLRQLLLQIQLVRTQSAIGQVHIIFGMVKDKDPGLVLSLLPPEYRYYFTQASLPRALGCTELQTAAATFGLSGGTYTTPDMALQTALARANENDLVVVCGSIFVVAEISAGILP